MYIWYEYLNKPFLSPPAYVFSIVWTILYLLMFISLVLYLKSNNGKWIEVPIVYFIMQLLLNLAWSPTFFGLRNMKLALIILILMIIFTFLTIFSFYKVSKISALLLVSYFVWICFALYLNFEFIKLN